MRLGHSRIAHTCARLWSWPGAREVRRWFPLHPSKSRQNSVHGEVLLRIHYKTQIPGGIDLDVKPNEELNDEAIAACKYEPRYSYARVSCVCVCARARARGDVRACGECSCACAAMYVRV